MNLLLLINGRSDLMLENNKIDIYSTDIIKIDEKDLSNFKKIVRLIKAKDYKNIYFGTIDLKFQRFHFFMKFFILLSKCRTGFILDETGKRESFKITKFFLLEFPAFMIEILLSSFTILYYYVKFPILRWMYIKKK